MNQQVSASEWLDVLMLFPGAVDGGADQIIMDIVPGIVERTPIRRWAIERTIGPIPMVALLLDVSADSLPDIVDDCEEAMSSVLRDEPGLVMQSLVEVRRDSRAAAELPTGVRLARIEAGTDARRLRDALPVQQAIGVLVRTILEGVRDGHWDRKAIAPTLLVSLLSRVAGEESTSCVAILEDHATALMHGLLADHPSHDATIRQFRENAQRLIACGTPILLNAGDRKALETAIGAELHDLTQALTTSSKAAGSLDLVPVWRSLAGGIGFTPVESAYLAILASSALRVVQ